MDRLQRQGLQPSAVITQRASSVTEHTISEIGPPSRSNQLDVSGTFESACDDHEAAVKLQQSESAQQAILESIA